MSLYYEMLDVIILTIDVIELMLFEELYFVLSITHVNTTCQMIDHRLNVDSCS